MMACLVLLSGCTASTPPAAPNGVSDSGVVVVAPHASKWFGFTYDGNGQAYVEVSVQVSNGVPIDVFLMDDANLDSYQAEETFYANCSDAFTTSTTFSCTVDAGHYSVVLDNSAAGAAKPTSVNCCEARVSWSYSAQDA